MPQADGGFARGGSHARAVVELHIRLDGEHDDRTRAQLVHKRLVEPAAPHLNTVGDGAFLAQRGR